MFSRYADRQVIDYAELCNEVDAPHVWWRGGAPQMYVDEMRMLSEEAKRVDPSIKILAHASTYARYRKTFPPLSPA